MYWTLFQHTGNYVIAVVFAVVVVVYISLHLSALHYAAMPLHDHYAQA